MPKQWTADCETYLRREYSRQSMQALADHFGCTPTAVKARAKKLGVQTGRRQIWTPAECDLLTKHYRQRGAQWCANKLSRPITQIYNCAHRLDLVERMQCATDQQIIDALRRDHPAGYSDTCIAARLAQQLGLGVDRHRVSAIRRQQQLPSNRSSHRVRAAVAAKTREQLQAAGVASLAELKTQRMNQWKRGRGWPEHLTVRAVQAIELFVRHGQLTRPQLCALMGLPSRKRTSPASMAPQGTVLGELQAAGLITRLQKAVRVPGDLRLHDERTKPTTRVNRFKYIDLYFINAGVHAHGQRTEAS